MKNTYLQILVAGLIISLCLIAALSIVGVIKISILHSVVIKILVSVIACIGFCAYTFLVVKGRCPKLHLLGFSILFEAIGYWWLKNWIGYVFIVLGFGLLIFSFKDEVNKER